jgi:hypothetical protein
LSPADLHAPACRRRPRCNDPARAQIETQSGHSFLYTIDNARLPDSQRTETDLAEAVLRARDLVLPAIAALLWSAAVSNGQAPADSSASPMPGGSVEQRWPTDETAEPAAPQPAMPSEQDNQPAQRETPRAQAQEPKAQSPARTEEHKVPPAQAQEPKVEPPAHAQERKVQPAASRAKPAEALTQRHKRATAESTTAPTGASKTTKPRHAAQKPAKPKKIRRARAQSAPNTATTQQPGAPAPFGLPSGGTALGSSQSGGAPFGSNPFGASPFGGAPFGAPPAASEPAGAKRRPSATTLQH